MALSPSSATAAAPNNKTPAQNTPAHNTEASFMFLTSSTAPRVEMTDPDAGEIVGKPLVLWKHAVNDKITTGGRCSVFCGRLRSLLSALRALRPERRRHPPPTPIRPAQCTG